MTEPSKDELDEILLLFAKQLRAVDYNKVKKTITSEQEAIDRVESHNYAKQALKQYCDRVAARARDETAKAYGGCTKCYGKGYATVIEYASGFDTDTDIGSPGGKVSYRKPPIRYCTCDRGKQLERIQQPNERAS